MELVERVLEAMEMALQRPEGVIGLSTHGGAIRHTLGWLFPGIEETYLIPNISVYRVEHDGETWSYGGRVFEGGNPHGTA